MEERLALFPDTVQILAAAKGEQLTVGGADLSALAAEHGTPLYLYDRATLEAALTAYRDALRAHYPGQREITYGSKAYLCLALAQWVAETELGLDCSSEGEIRIAQAGGVERQRIVVHGVNKTPGFLTAAVHGAGTLVVDGLDELELLATLWPDDLPAKPEIWLRFRPGVCVQTHAFTRTGQGASKFGMAQAEILQAARICRNRRLPFTGLHFHLGSQFRDLAPIGDAVERTLDLMLELGTGEEWALCPGGGLGVAYHENDLPQPDIEAYVGFLAACVLTGSRNRGMRLPRLILEPGRSLIARAGVALYRVGATKVSGGRRWLLLDGGLADNPRPALYGTRYSALPIWEPMRHVRGLAWLGGPYCESGDVLIEALPLPEITTGELIAVPMSGAYQLSMASNYNAACRPAVLWLDGGSAGLIQQRERTADLLRRDLDLPPRALQSAMR